MMFIQTRVMVVEKGYSHKLVERFSAPSPVEEMPMLNSNDELPIS
ncbi:hypothetical protein [Paenibacillus sp. FSL K6-0108]